MQVPCGQCVGCRLSKAQQWATRMHHEASLHSANSFLTLTYDDAHLPDDFSVSVREMQLFMKRLRKAISPLKVRFFACGEYGDENYRPHYHLILFGYDFPDKSPWRQTPRGYVTYISAQLAELWPYGFHEIGNVSSESAGYVARYALKKLTGRRAEDGYQRLHPLTGEVVTVAPEFGVMSRRPGLGANWVSKYKCDVYPSDFLVVEGQKVPVPRFYKQQLSEREQERVTIKRISAANKHKENNTAKRLEVRAKVTQLRIKALKREL